MDRQDFMDIVYAELASDPDNNRANRIIWAADGYAESAQLGTDCISRHAAIDVLKQMRKDGNLIPWEGKKVFEAIRNLPSAQPETATVTIGRTRGGITMWYKCDACDEPVDQNDNYCRNCGRKLKHE